MDLKNDEMNPQIPDDGEKVLLINDVADESNENDAVEMANHHHHHHHHHHHSSHGHSSKKGKKHHSSRKRSKKRTSARKKAIIICTIVVVLAVLFVSIYIAETRNSSIEGGKKSDVVLNGNFAIQSKYMDEEVDIVHDVAKYCYELDSDISVLTAVKKFARDPGITFDQSVPVTLEYQVHNLPEGEEIESCTVEVSEYEDFSESDKFVFIINEPIELNYLKTNTKYYYRVNFEPVDRGYSGCFETSDTPRILTIDGIGNVRDIGNWKTADGGRIKQGLLYRGTELEGAVQPDYRLTETGKRVILDVLGIKYEMDLRSISDNPTNIEMLADAVEHKYYNSPMYKDIFTEDGKEKIKNIFTDLADPGNYPMYLHCTYGLDRTGTVCFLLEALLGVSDDDLKKDYELSALFRFTLNSDSYETMLTSLDEYDGGTTCEKVENYLLDCGISREQMESIRSIFLEE